MDTSPSQADTEARFAAEIEKHMRRTFSPRVLEDGGPLAGMFSLDYDARLFAKNYRQPVLVSSVASVGAKASLAQMLKRHDAIGRDLVANTVNRVVARGAEPLLFAAYLESAHLDPQISFPIIKGIADACCQAECALIETATPERPGAYQHGDYHLAGFGIGVAERSRLVTDRRFEVGDAILALPSSGLHTNGHTMARRIFFDKLKMSPATHIDELACSIGEELARPTAIYAKPLKKLLQCYRVKKVVRCISCVGDGGLLEAVRRAAANSFSAKIELSAIPRQPVFELIRKLGELDERQMFGVFNMGVGAVVIVSQHFVDSIIRHLRRSNQPASIIGRIDRGPNPVEFV